MTRKQIRLAEQDSHPAKVEACRLGISLAELFRRSPWMRYAGMVGSRDRRSRRRLDDVIYSPKN